MHKYLTYFDATQAGWHTWPPILIPSILTVLFALVFFGLLRRKGGLPKIVGILLCCFSAMMSLLVFYTQYHEYATIREAATVNGFKVVEGKIEDFVPMPYSGHAQEKFCVAKVCFAYSDYSASSGFSQTSSHGGPIHEGLQARITYLDYNGMINAGNIIVKLEIGQ